LVAAAIGALGYTTYMMYRETRLEGIVAAPSIDLAQVVVTRDFRAEALMLAKELAMSRAPLLSDIRQIEEAFARIRGDVAGRDERIRLLGQEVEELEKEVDTVIKEASAEARGLWETEGLAMNAEYEQKLTAFEQQLITRAEQLKVKFEPSKEYRVPEVWVNAFRLALYNAPPSVNTGAQRQWAEQQLGLWKEYCKIWDEKMAALKERIKKVQSSPKEKIDQITARRNDLRAQMAETEVEVGPLRREMEEQQQNLVRVKSEEASLEKTFYPQLIKTVDENRLFTVPFRPEDKTFSWRRIDRMPQFPPGKYFLWLKGYIDNEEYWSVVPFTLNSYSTTELVIYSGAFVKVSDILRSSINE
jgi:septal ring factor EnvC (AmiA/AmiB activator)